jgi:hypothetical protein
MMVDGQCRDLPGHRARAANDLLGRLGGRPACCPPPPLLLLLLPAPSLS